MKIEKEARRDARELARAQMYYGEGAGTRRKLISATVEAKSLRNPIYQRALEMELSRQDMAEHADKARKERRRKDATESVTKNTKALVTGNYQNAQSTVLTVVVVGYFLHQTGLDKKAYAKGKQLVEDAKIRWRRRTLKAVPIDVEFGKENR